MKVDCWEKSFMFNDPVWEDIKWLSIILFQYWYHDMQSRLIDGNTLIACFLKHKVFIVSWVGVTQIGVSVPLEVL